MDLSKYIPALEAILFAGGEPVPAARIAAALELSEQNVEKTAVLLEQKLSSKDSGIELLKLSDGYQLATKKQFEEPIRTVFELRRSTPLSSAAFEVLAVVLFAPMILGVTRVEAAVMGAVLLIALALVIRSVGVCLCVARTKLTKRERLFCVIAYLPKATVQAAIGAMPLAMGLPCGNLVLSVAVLAILLTAPLGAIGVDATADRMLQK